MKKILYIFLALGLLSIFGWTIYSLYQQSQAKSEIFKTEKPVITDIIKKSVATGSIVPRREIVIKPRLSGIVEKIYVKPGQSVKEGDIIALLKIIPNLVNLNNAEANLAQAKINLANAEREFIRNEKLYKDKLIAEAEFYQFQVDFQRRKEETIAAENNLQLTREGAAKKSKTGNNKVYSTVSGMVLDIPVREGSTVIESNNFNEGTTIATVADMNDMIFEGKIEESEVDKVKEGMDLILTIGAIEGKVFPARLTFISPKGIEVEGAIQFEIKAKVNLPENEFIRAGYSSTADIVLAKAEKVLAIPEKLLQFDKVTPFVEVENKPQVFEKRNIQLGLSDGIMVEVKNGLDSTSNIKIPGNENGELK